MLKMIDIKLIDPSPFQIRKYFDPDPLKELAKSILRGGTIAPIMVRRIGERYEIIVGEKAVSGCPGLYEYENHSRLKSLRQRTVKRAVSRLMKTSCGKIFPSIETD